MQKRPVFSRFGRSLLLQEAALLILFIYLVMVGGTYNGAVLRSLQLLNTLLLGGVGLTWLLWSALRKKWQPGSLLDLPLLAWLGVTALAALFSVNPRLSGEGFAQSLVYGLWFCFVVDLLRGGWDESLWLRVLRISGGVVIAFGLLEIGLWYEGWFLVGGWADPIPPATFRVHSTLGHANILAAYLNLLLGLGLAGLFQARSRAARWLAGVEVGLILGLLFFTSSRGGWLGTAAVLGVFGVLLGLDRRAWLIQAWAVLRRRWVLLGGLGLAVLLTVGLAVGLLYRQMQHPSHPGLENPGTARSYIWSVALRMAGQHPLLGEGPLTFGTEFIRTYSYPPTMLLAHAHNYLLNSLAEMGAAGALTVLGLGAALVWAAFRRWRGGKAGERATLAGVIAALAGLAVHSQLDTPETVLVINLSVSVLIAVLVAPLRAEGLLRLPSWLGSERVVLLLRAIGLSLALGMQLFSLQASGLYERGLAAAQTGDWPAAAGWIDAAVSRDPSFALYHFQSGLVHARLAFGLAELPAPEAGLVRAVVSEPELRAARQAFEAGLALDDSSALNWVNRGVLAWAAGERAEGAASLATAAARAPESGWILRLSGWMAETSGQADAARAAYRRLMAVEPQAAQSDFFQATPLRQAFGGPGPQALGGWALLAAGDALGAEAAFRAELGLNTGLAYRGLGQALTAQRRLAEAEKALRTALFIDPGQPDTLQALADLSAAQSQPDRAQAYHSAAAVARENPTGAEKLGDADAALYVYHREALGFFVAGLQPLP